MFNMASMASPWKHSIKFLCRTFNELVTTSQMHDDDTIRPILEDLKAGRSSPDPDFINRQLMLLFTNQLIDEKTRVQSGKTLESNIDDRFCHFPIQLVDFLKSECLLALDDPSPVIRATVFALIEAILLKIEKFSNWSGIFPKLSQMLDSTENSDLEGVFHALQSTHEDFSSELMSIVGLHNELISKLLQFSNHTIPKIRASSYTTLGHFVELGVTKPYDDSFPTILAVLFQGILDENELIQSAACPALARVQKTVSEAIVPYLDAIVETVVAAFAKYQRKNLLHLYYVIATLAKSVGKEEMNKPQYINLLLPPIAINADASNIPDDDGDLVKRMECLQRIVQALRTGFGFAPFSEGLLRSCIWIINQHQHEQEQPDSMEPLPDKGLLVAALKLISGFVETPDEITNDFIHSSELMFLLCRCVKDRSPEVREASFYLLKSLCSTCYHNLRPFLDHLMTIIGENLNPDSPSVCQAAILVIGVVHSQMGKGEMNQYILMLLPQLISMINQSDGIKMDLLEDAASLLHDLVSSYPKHDTPSLFISDRMGNLNSKAFCIWCDLITSKNLDDRFRHLLVFCSTVASWSDPSELLKEKIIQTLLLFKNRYGDWMDFVTSIPSDTLDRMKILYGDVFS